MLFHWHQHLPLSPSSSVAAACVLLLVVLAASSGWFALSFSLQFSPRSEVSFWHGRINFVTARVEFVTQYEIFCPINPSHVNLAIRSWICARIVGYKVMTVI